MKQTDLEYEILEAQRIEYQNRTPIEDVIIYTIPCSIVGTVSGFIGGLVSYLFTKDPVYLAYGTSLGALAGTILGALSAEHIADAEYNKIIEKQKKL